MKACDFCGCKVDEKERSCPSCGSTAFRHVCPKCSNLFEGSYCTKCGVRYDAVPKTCPECGTKFFTRFCTHCGYNPEKSWKADDGSFRTVRTFNSNNTNGNGMLAMIFGCIGLFTCLFPFSILAIVYALKDKKNGTYTKQSQVGLYLGIAALVLGVFLVLNACIQSLSNIR